MIIGFKAILLLSFIFSFHTFKYGLSNIWRNRLYLSELYTKDKKNNMHYKTYTCDDYCELVKYDCNNDITIKQIILPKNKNLDLINNYFKKNIDKDSVFTIDSNIEINTFTEPKTIIMWAS
jgi:hypothetical protein